MPWGAQSDKTVEKQEVGEEVLMVLWKPAEVSAQWPAASASELRKTLLLRRPMEQMLFFCWLSSLTHCHDLGLEHFSLSHTVSNFERDGTDGFNGPPEINSLTSSIRGNQHVKIHKGWVSIQGLHLVKAARKASYVLTLCWGLVWRLFPIPDFVNSHI